jgi:hypothetical protein
VKWTNKGHEFDEPGQYLKNISKIYVFGAGHHGEQFYRHLEWLGIENDFDINYVDSNPAKQNSLFMGRRVIPPVRLKAEFCGGSVLIIAAEQNVMEEILGTLDHGTVEIGRNCFTTCWVNAKAPLTGRVFFPVLMLYRYGKLYTDMAAHIPTSRCNLRCRHCLNFIPSFREPKDSPLDVAVSEADAYFSKVDFCALYNINGGEVFLMPHLHEIINYIGDKYRDRIYELLLITNGTVTPPPVLVDAVKANNVRVKVDDYRDAVPSISERYNKVIDVLSRAGVNYYVHKTDTWINLLDNAVKLAGDGDCRARNSACAIPYRHLKGTRLAHCDWNSFAADAGVYADNDSDYIDILAASKAELMEFQIGFTEKGYVTMCRECNGHLTINKNFVPAAEQVSAGEA